MQQSKLLTSGEGGAVITDDQKLYHLMEQLRSDGRNFTDNPQLRKLELNEIGDIQGQNMCLSEFQSAILLEGLSVLEEQNIIRNKRAKLLSELLSDIGIDFLRLDPNISTPTYYNYVIKLNLDEFHGNSVDSVSRALSEELKASINPVYRPLNDHPLYCPLKSPRISKDKKIREQYDPKRFLLPNATEIRRTCITLHHSLLLEDEEGIIQIANAINKVRIHSSHLLETPQEVFNIGF